MRQFGAEFVGTALLLVVIVGTGIVASTDGAASAQLFQHAVAVGVGLAALILVLGPVSGAHFNPVVTIVDAAFGGMAWSRAGGYVVAQVSGAVVGVVVTNLIFSLRWVETATTVRTGGALVGSEAVATFGLLLVIFGMVQRGRTAAVPGAVGAWIAAAIYATPSAAFANPAVTVARTMSDTYTGIAPGGVPGFVLGQVLGAAAAWLVVWWLFAPDPAQAADVVVPHDTEVLETTGAGR